ncbi:MAG: hypothetical protein ACRC6E_03205 [Fusobacteriaceae bacterium]
MNVELELKHIDIEFLNQSYFPEILETILNKVANSSSDRKIKRFYEILKKI